MPQEKLTQKKYFSLLGLGFFLSALCPFLAAPFLRVLRNAESPIRYWLPGILILFALTSIGGAMMAIFIFGNWLVVGLFAELEERGRGDFYAGLISVLVTTAFVYFGPGLWQLMSGQPVAQELQASFDLMFSSLHTKKEDLQALQMMGFKMESLKSLVPSIIGIVVLMNLSFALMLDRRGAKMVGVNFERYAGTTRTLDFTVPAPFLWLTLVSFLFSFLDLKQPLLTSVALNTFQFMVGVYFFQGLAIVESAFLVYRVGAISRAIFYILVVGNLFFLLSLLGLADFWFDLRERLRRPKVKE